MTAPDRYEGRFWTACDDLPEDAKPCRVHEAHWHELIKGRNWIRPGHRPLLMERAVRAWYVRIDGIALEGEYAIRCTPGEYKVLAALLAERRRAHRKHEATSMEQAEPLEHFRCSIVTEEAGEVARVLNDLRHDLSKDEDRSPQRQREITESATAHLRKELIQLGAMALTWAANLDDDRLSRDTSV